MPAHSVRFDPVDLAEDPSVIPCGDCGTPLEWFQGECYCPGCVQWEPTERRVLIPVIDPYRKG